MRPSSIIPFALVVLFIATPQAKSAVFISSVKWSLGAGAFDFPTPQPDDVIIDSQDKDGFLTSLNFSANISAHAGRGNGYIYYQSQLIPGGLTFTADAYGYAYSDSEGFGLMSSTVNFTVTGTTTIEFTRDGAGFSEVRLQTINPLDTNFNTQYRSLPGSLSPLQLNAGAYSLFFQVRGDNDYGIDYPISAQFTFHDSAIRAFTIPEVGTLLSCSAGLLVLLGLHPSCRSFVRRRVLPSATR